MRIISALFSKIKVLKIKSILQALLLFMLITALMPAISSHAASTLSHTGTVTADDVNLRSEPKTSSTILEKLPKLSKVTVLSYDSNWYHVVYNGQTGYIRQDMMFASSLTDRLAYVCNDDTRLYGGPDTSSYVVCSLNTGDPLKIKALLGDWYFCSTGTDSGYVHMDNVVIARPGSSSLDKMLMTGMTGKEVQKLQNELYERGFLSVLDMTGYYGNHTQDAVREFQTACGLPSDGIAGDATLSLVYDEGNTVTHDNALFNQVRGTVELLAWDEGGSSWLGRGAYFMVTDVRTGLSFHVRRFGGWFHADSEPVTAEDTAIMNKISGGTWSWNRRPIWVTYNGRTVAASMHTMPHMANPTWSNNFDGHFCIHLLHSKVHANSKECPRHQACVMEAYEAGRRND